MYRADARGLPTYRASIIDQGASLPGASSSARYAAVGRLLDLLAVPPLSY